MCKSGLRKVLTVRLSVLMNGTQASPSMSLHRAWVFWLYQNPNSPTPPPALCLHHVVRPLVTQAAARAQDGPDAAPMGPSFLLPALLSALQLLTTVPLPVAGKGLWLPTPSRPQSPPQACLVPQTGPKRVVYLSERWLPAGGPRVVSSNAQHTKDAHQQMNDGINEYTNAKFKCTVTSLWGLSYSPAASCLVFFAAVSVLELKCLGSFLMSSTGLSLPWAGVCPGLLAGPGTCHGGRSNLG